MRGIGTRAVTVIGLSFVIGRVRLVSPAGCQRSLLIRFFENSRDPGACGVSRETSAVHNADVLCVPVGTRHDPLEVLAWGGAVNHA